MKKFFLLFLTFLVLTGTAAADVIWEPRDDFYEEHYQDCTYVNSRYYANSPAGSVAGYKKPNGKKYASYENGTILYVSYIWDGGDDERWGIVEDWSEDTSCWVPMADLVHIYDAESFSNEFGKTFTAYDDSFEELCQSEDIPVVFWTFPCSGEIITTLEHLSQDYSPLTPTWLYTDEEGRIWGSQGYYMGLRGWVCLSDPSNEEIPAVQYASYELYPASGEAAAQTDDPAPTAASNPDLSAEPGVEALGDTAETLTRVGIGVGSITALSALLLFIMKLRKKK